MKKSLIAILLILVLTVSPVLLCSCNNNESVIQDGTTGSSEPINSNGVPDTEEHVHAYEFALINYGEGFALEGHCTVAKCTEPTVIVDEGLVPVYDYVAPTCTHEGNGTWSYTKDDQVYTLTVTFQPVADNHSFAEGSCIYCGTDKIADQPDHVHSWTTATCTMPATCSTCGTTNGNALGHTWIAATCTSAKTCSVCAAKSGSELGHSFSQGNCSVCGLADPNYTGTDAHAHTDSNNDDKCDTCYASVVVIIDFYAINDLHGKFCDTAKQPGVDNLATYLKEREKYDDNVIIFSSGDMWQGAAESNLTNGVLLTEWMNEMNFVSMTLGNHEYDWGEDAIRENLAVAEFPFLAINIYNKTTGKRADYCTPSVIVERDGIQIGIIGAIGDCYSSISSDMVSNVEFKVGRELTALVKAESERLRAQGVDLIVYSLHDGYGSSNYSGSSVSAGNISSYYDTVLSNGYVDVVFEGHTHQSYVLYDNYGVYHMQGGGENKGITHVELSLNYITGKKSVTSAEVVRSSVYSGYAEDSATNALEDKYSDVIDSAYKVIGNVSYKQSSTAIKNVVAELYLKAGLERWGDQYDIVLGGGFLKTRSPYDLAAGPVTYSDILSLLPFDNRLVLCSVSGRNLSRVFVNTNNTNYASAYSEYGNSIKKNISSNKTYYVVVDTYTALYAPNNLTVVDYYDEDVYARDLLAAEIAAGRFDSGRSVSASVNDSVYYVPTNKPRPFWTGFISWRLSREIRILLVSNNKDHPFGWSFVWQRRRDLFAFSFRWNEN